MNYEIALLLAVLAFVYSNLLTEPGHLLAKWYRMWYVVFKTDKRLMDGKPYHPLFMLIVHCEKCIAGEFAFWYFLYKNLSTYQPQTALWHLCFTATAILFAAVLKGLYNRYIK